MQEEATNNIIQVIFGDNCRFISNNKWPPESADLNAVDYYVWPLLLSMKVDEGSRTPFTMEELKNKIIQYWGTLELDIMRKSIICFRKRLSRVVNEKGSQINYYWK